MIGNHVERKDEVARVGRVANPVTDVDEEEALIIRVGRDDHIADFDPGLPAQQCTAHLVRDLSGRCRIGRSEYVVMDSAAKIGAQRPLARSRAEDDRDRLFDLSLARDERDVTRRIDP